jgi:uncharacterized membrane protein YraQ (UPF0718 family)
MTSNTTQPDYTKLKWMTFILIAVAGLFYVKWSPYYHRAFVAASNHAIGSSILMGTAASPPSPSFDAALSYAMAYGKAIWQAMVLGLLLGSGVQALLPPQWIIKVFGRSGFGSVVAGGLLSVPAMMCTCCAAPVVAGLRARSASPGAAVAFWLGNTILNPATLIFMGFVLGWNWTGLRLVLGLIMVFGLGYFANRSMTNQEATAAQTQLNQIVATDGANENAFKRWMKILGKMSIRLIPEYIILVLILGAARALLFPHIGPEITNHLGWILFFAVAGTLFVIPTAGEVPIIQAMLALGIGVGPAGALLMTLPPISVPSIAMLYRSFKPRLLINVTGTVIAFGILSGLLAVGLGF